MPQCTRCKVYKEPSEFKTLPLHEDKLSKQCILCIDQQKIYRKKNIDKDKVKQQKYYNSNKEKIVKIREARFNTLNGRLKKILANIKNHEKDCNLDIEYLIDMFNKQNGKCAITLIEMVYKNDTNYRSHPFMISIDRINNKLGHVKGNIRLVCFAVNCALNEWGEIIFGKICAEYINHHSLITENNIPRFAQSK